MASSKAKRSATSRRSGSGKDARSSSSKWPFLVASVAILASVLWDTYTRQAQENDDDDDNIVVTTIDNSDCGLIMAQSALPNNAGWGMFALKDVELYDQVLGGEVVIQLTNLLVEYTSDFHVMLENYAWEAHNGAGTMEASSVYSLLPGAGSLANGHPSLNNVKARLPEVTHSGVTRKKSPGAGASSHYHNLKWLAFKPIQAGDEVIVSYGSTWFKKLSFDNPDKPRRTVQELRDTGMCIDNIRPGASTIKHAGRGAFATRNIPKGYVIAPAPLIVIPRREALTSRRDVQNPTQPWKQHQVVSQQLLLNYCFGHSNSSLLFCPYGPGTSLINHASKEHANAKVQWSQSEHLFGANRGMLEWPLDMIQSHKRTGLLLEIFATRDIKEGEEIFLNYGPAWEAAWNQHVANWKANDNDNYQYPFEVDMTDPLTVDYAENVQMSCFYSSKRGGETTASSSTFAVTNAHDMVVQWEHPPMGTVVKRVQPCRVIGRDDSNGLYTAKLLDDNIVVTHMPHSAIVLKDKPHTSDQHLDNAFRHEIGIQNHIFPKQWMDLAK